MEWSSIDAVGIMSPSPGHPLMVGAMTGQNFSTEAYPATDRLRAWQAELGPLGVVAREDGAGPFHGRITRTQTQGGMQIARIAASAQILAFQPRAGASGLWLLLLQEGQGRLREAETELALRPGDLAFGMAGGRASLALPGMHQLVLVHMPETLLKPRLITPLAGTATKLVGKSGTGRVLANLLASVTDPDHALPPEQMNPLDIALPEFLVAAVAGRPMPASPLPSLLGGAQAALLHRVCQSIEARLGDPDLSLAALAQEQGMSARSVQKLFETAGARFSLYVKQRRLERCRSDLGNPLYAHLGISTIAFRWGFNEAAHFSRTFSEQFGCAPRAFRRAALPLPGAASGADAEAAHPLRGRPIARAAGETLRAEGVPPPGVEDGERPLLHAGQTHHQLAANSRTIHWGYFSRRLPPVLNVQSGDFVTIETLTQHANDDPARMVAGDAGAQSVFGWTAEHKNVDRRGAGPMDASIHGRGAGEGFGVHICTGPIAIRGATPGDVVELRVLDITPRLSANPDYAGRCFGSNAATWWGFHHSDLLTEPKPREVVTIYEVDADLSCGCARAVYSYRWTPQTDPSGIVHATIDYPGVPVDPASILPRQDILRNVRVPLRPHFGVVALAPEQMGLVDSVPPAAFGGNIDNWRLGKGAKVFLPVAVPGALLSIGDPHAAQGDSELCGTAIECSLTGSFQIILHSKASLPGTLIADLDYPLIETQTEWVVQGFSYPRYLTELGKDAQTEVYRKSTIDLAMRDAFRKTRRFLMAGKGLSEDEAISLMSVAVDFAVTQVVDGNWGVHATIRKAMFET